MADFNIRCPKSYPNVCDLPQPEREHLLKIAKYRIFFMLQFDRDDKYVIDVVEEYFAQPYHLIKADVQPGNSVKICKICKCALACDCGIAVLTPSNPNVYTEIGMLLALGKPVLLLMNTNEMKAEDIPFDLNSRMVITYNDETSLKEGLKREVPLFEDLLELRTQFEMDWEEHVKQEILKLRINHAKIVVELLFANTFVNDYELVVKLNINMEQVDFNKLCSEGFLVKKIEYLNGVPHKKYYSINYKHEDILRRNYTLIKKQAEKFSDKDVL